MKLPTWNQSEVSVTIAKRQSR